MAAIVKRVQIKCKKQKYENYKRVAAILNENIHIWEGEKGDGDKELYYASLPAT